MKGMQLRSRKNKDRPSSDDDDNAVEQRRDRQVRVPSSNQSDVSTSESTVLGTRADKLTDAFNGVINKEESNGQSKNSSESGYADSDEQGSHSLGSESTWSTSSELSAPAYSIVSGYFESNEEASRAEQTSQTDSEEDAAGSSYNYGQYPDVFETEEEERLEIAAINDLKSKDTSYQNASGVSGRFIGNDGRKQYLITWASGETSWHYGDKINPTRHLLKAMEQVDKMCNLNPNSRLFASSTPKVRGASGGLKLFKE